MRKFVSVLFLIASSWAAFRVQGFAVPPPSCNVVTGSSSTTLLNVKKTKGSPAKGKNKAALLSSKRKQGPVTSKINSSSGKDFEPTPATLIFYPIVALVGIDLLLNIGVLLKRTLDYFVLGKAPSLETWW